MTKMFRKALFGEERGNHLIKEKSLGVRTKEGIIGRKVKTANQAARIGSLKMRKMRKNGTKTGAEKEQPQNGGVKAKRI